MPLPESTRVKLSSEGAEYISITPVVVREMPTRELIELMLGITGKDVGRVRELLLRGTLVSGASRFRWEGWDADRADLEAVLATFPDPDPSRPFTREHCVRAVLKGAACRIELTREACAQKRFLHRTSFWDVLMAVAAAGAPRYLDYSYKERVDCYRMEVSSATAARLKESAALVKYSTLGNQLRSALLETVDLFVERSSA